MAARKSPLGMVHRDKHEQMLDDMHGALSSLGDKIRKPFQPSGEKLLPADLQNAEKPEAKAARKHIEKLHGAFKGHKGK